MSKARTLANLISDNAELADGQISVAEVVGIDTNYYNKTESDSRYVRDTGDIMTGNLTIKNAYPRIDLVDTNHDPDWAIINADGKFIVYDETNSVIRLELNTTGAEISGTVQVDGLYTWSPGTSNLRLGKDAGKVLASGAIGNTISGDDAGKSSTTPDYNSFYGFQSGYSNLVGTRNSFFGKLSGYHMLGSANSILGGYTGNQHGLDLRNSNNNIILSDGDGNARVHINSTGVSDFKGNVKATKFIGDGSELTNVVNTGFGEVGTYTIAMYKNDPAGRKVDGGDTVSGSELDAHMDGNHAQPLIQYEYRAAKINQNAGFAGTWRLMVTRIQLWNTAGTNQWVGGFWLRIS